ncbi:hypothetical protein CROQUDRAFT_93559 [Cronartium quercuum f. sp. fusiforme G11]|uniref:Uncharacterized protein n=1 Tax=Cronartium quercuum f. sp. fusiforme G11 TaxID=708437 RepID=A0A9P6NK75_9BASI|nr:hypothetical protein CROQUDRAFT_93559 [Cronartium quercuum f. sp. fusiforme G11]
MLGTSLVNGSLASQTKAIGTEFNRHINQTAKKPQVETILSLLNGFNTFLLEGTSTSARHHQT